MSKAFVSRYIFHDHIATAVARLYSNEFKEVFLVPVGDCPQYDLISKSGKYRVEVKFETTPARTNCVAIEYWNTDLNQPSGILSTEANLWLHIIPNGKEYEAYEYDVNTLRKLVIEEGEIKSNGRNSLCKIISLDTFKQHAQRVFPFELDFFTNN